MKQLAKEFLESVPLFKQSESQLTQFHNSFISDLSSNEMASKVEQAIIFINTTQENATKARQHERLNYLRQQLFSARKQFYMMPASRTTTNTHNINLLRAAVRQGNYETAQEFIDNLQKALLMPSETRELLEIVSMFTAHMGKVKTKYPGAHKHFFLGAGA